MRVKRASSSTELMITPCSRVYSIEEYGNPARFKASSALLRTRFRNNDETITSRFDEDNRLYRMPQGLRARPLDYFFLVETFCYVYISRDLKQRVNYSNITYSKENKYIESFLLSIRCKLKSLLEDN